MTFPPDFPTPTRDDLIEDYLRDVRFASDGEQATTEGGQAEIDGSALADTLVPGYLATNRAGHSFNMLDATGEDVNVWARSLGQPERQPATSAIGYVVVQTAQGGTTPLVGDELKTTSGVLLKVLASKKVYTGDLIAVQAKTAGPSTNLPAGTRVTWTSPRPGCLPDATVWADADGQGLIGGRLAETDTEVVERLRDRLADPPSAGNDAHIRELVRAAGRALGIPVQAAFTYPAILGPGTTSVVFTVTPTQSGGSRIPNPAQIAAVEGWVKEQLPGDDSLFFATLENLSAYLALRVAWRDGASGWIDLPTWPPEIVGNSPVVVSPSPAPTPTVFTLARTLGDYTSFAQPKAGQTIATYDRATATFKRKRILSFTGTGPWVITVDTTGDASDTGYTPDALSLVSPWAESLNLLPAALCAEFDRLGPGEQVASFFDEGTRQRRQPLPAASWDSRIGSRVVNGVQDLPAVLDAQLLYPAPSDLPKAVSVGTAGTLSWLFFLRDLAVFPL